MNWDAVGAVAELLGALGVIASLLYVGVQVRQNTRSIRASTYDALVRSSAEWLNPLIQDPGLAASFEEAVLGWDRVDDAHRGRIMYLLTQLFRTWENAFFQARQGTLAPSLWSAWQRVILGYYHRPGIQEWWRIRRDAYSSEFQDFLESSSPPAVPIRTTRELAGGAAPSPSPQRST